MLTLLLAGCPTHPGGSSPVHAAIMISSPEGAAPLEVVVSGELSTSDNGGDLEYFWDFGDGTTATDVSATHTFTEPGQYVVTLRVTDSTGAQDEATQEVRVAGPPAVTISADMTSGQAPLLVQFHALRYVPDGRVAEYSWDFGDGGESTVADPEHTYFVEGEYEVSLRIVTTDGLEGRAATTISVAARSASLEFSGASFATLPQSWRLPGEHTIYIWVTPEDEFGTIEIWVKPENEGGTVLSAGELTIEVHPADNRITLTKAGSSLDASAADLATHWHHVAAVCSADGPAGSTVLYLDGSAIGELGVGAPLSSGTITIGSGFRGRIADVRFWSVARSAAQISAERGKRLKGTEAGLYGYWPLNEGSGQTLHNLGSRRSFVDDGTLGLSTEQEAADPAWSSDGPPI
jgi:PKD repeat protein